MTFRPNYRTVRLVRDEKAVKRGGVGNLGDVEKQGEKQKRKKK